MFSARNAHSSRLHPLAAALAGFLAVTPGAGAALGQGATAVDFNTAGGHVAHSVASSSAVAMVVPVLNCDDGSPGSLREIYANAVDNEVIDLSQLTCSRITLTLGALVDPPSATNVSLQGPGRDLLAIDGDGRDRVVVHRGTGGLHVDALTITNGRYAGTNSGGGCVSSNGGLEATASRFSSCTVDDSSYVAAGGAIYAKGTINLFGSIVADSTATAAHGVALGGGIFATGAVIARSTISGNTATNGRGGGLFVDGGGPITVADSTFSGNRAAVGGGVFDDTTGRCTIQNSTFAENGAATAGGAIYSLHETLVFNSTVARNTLSAGGAGTGAGIFIATNGGESEVESSIVVENTANNGLIESDVSIANTAYVSGTHNVVIAVTALPGSSEGISEDAITADPLLGPLQDNGGETKTLALLPGSPAIDHGSNVLSLANDQRGAPFPRVDGSRADIGAVEFVDTIFAAGFDQGAPPLIDSSEERSR